MSLREFLAVLTFLYPLMSQIFIPSLSFTLSVMLLVLNEPVTPKCATRSSKFSFRELMMYLDFYP